jgi:predicted N-acetyltransferase YhbS
VHVFTFTEETSQDWWEVEALFDTCFAPGRQALSSYRLREDGPPCADLCLLARDDAGQVVAAIRYWPVRVGAHRALLLGPVAVHPTAQGEGLGAALIATTLRRAADLGEARVLLIGDAPYYGRFGFDRLSGVSMPGPTNPDRVLGHALVPGAWHGVDGPVAPWQPKKT